jgi:large-conductance mechanosensitive channel
MKTPEKIGAKAMRFQKKFRTPEEQKGNGNKSKTRLGAPIIHIIDFIIIADFVFAI